MQPMQPQNGPAVPGRLQRLDQGRNSGAIDVGNLAQLDDQRARGVRLQDAQEAIAKRWRRLDVKTSTQTHLGAPVGVTDGDL